MKMVRRGTTALLAAATLLGATGALFAQETATLEERVKALESKSAKQDEKKPADGTFKVFWKDGLNFETADKAFKAKLGGRIHQDYSWISEDTSIKASAIGDQEDGVEFRRVRLYLSGDVYEDIFFKIQMDFAGGDADFKDVFVGMRNLPTIGHLRVGQQYEPMGLETQTSSNYITFIERSLPITFLPERNTGVMVYNTFADNRVYVGVGAFRDSDDFGNAAVEGEGAVTGRIAGQPWWEDGLHFVHVGAAVSQRAPNNDTLRFRARPEVALSDRFADTGNFEADAATIFGFESAVVYGPFSAQAEFVLADMDSDPADDPSLSGYYVYASWFLTGESRAYKQADALFSGVKPHENFDMEAGTWGAFELAARLSVLDLEDGNLSGGELMDVTLGVNWYLNPNFRVMLNYVNASLEERNNGAIEGDADIFMIRFDLHV